jgi:hypothetical protein
MMVSKEAQHKTGQFKREVLQQLLKLNDKKAFNQSYLKPALNAGLIEMTIPDKPTSRLQQYRLMVLGKTMEMDLAK